VTIATRVAGLTPVASDTDGAQAAKYERVVEELVEGVIAVRRELDGAPAPAVQRAVARHLSGDTPGRQLEWLRARRAEAAKIAAAVEERREQLMSVGVLTRGARDDSDRTAAREREIRDHIRAADPVERPSLAAAALASGDAAAIRAVLDDPLEIIAGPLVPRETLTPIVEQASRQMFSDAWERLDAQASAAAQTELYSDLTIEALGRAGISVEPDAIAAMLVDAGDDA